jgi:hypothetical protein
MVLVSYCIYLTCFNFSIYEYDEAPGFISPYGQGVYRLGTEDHLHTHQGQEGSE